MVRRDPDILHDSWYDVMLLDFILIDFVTQIFKYFSNLQSERPSGVFT